MITVVWPNGQQTLVTPGTPWLQAAQQAGCLIPTGCLGGSCGACEIEVNGQLVRACIAAVPACRSAQLDVEWASDPYW